MDNKEKELLEVSKPVIEFLKKYYHPHAVVVININSAEVLEGLMAVHVEDSTT